MKQVNSIGARLGSTGWQTNVKDSVNNEISRKLKLKRRLVKAYKWVLTYKEFTLCFLITPVLIRNWYIRSLFSLKIWIIIFSVVLIQLVVYFIVARGRWACGLIVMNWLQIMRDKIIRALFGIGKHSVILNGEVEMLHRSVIVMWYTTWLVFVLVIGLMPTVTCICATLFSYRLIALTCASVLNESSGLMNVWARLLTMMRLFGSIVSGDIMLLSLRPTFPFQLIKVWMDDMVPSVKKVPKVTWLLPEYYDGQRSVKMTYHEARHFGAKLIESLNGDLDNKRWQTIFEWNARYPDFIRDIDVGRYGSKLKNDMEEFHSKMKSVAKDEGVKMPPWFLSILDHSPSATASNATNAFTLTQRLVDARGEILLFDASRKCSLELAKARKDGITQDFGDFNILYANANGGVKAQVESMLNKTEGFTVDAVQNKIVDSTKPQKLAEHIKSTGSPGTRSVITLRDSEQMYANGAVDEINKYKWKRRETDVVSLDYAKKQTSQHYERFVKQQNDLSTLAGGNAVIHEAVNSHLSKSVNKGELFTAVNDSNRRHVRFHDTKLKISTKPA